MNGEAALSPFEHFAMSVRGLGWHRALFGMFTAYFDRSGETPPHRCIALAGFTATTRAWLDFEPRFVEILTEFDVPFLHMKALAHCAPPYEKWRTNERERVAFLQAVVKVISDVAEHSTVVVVSRDAFKSVNERYRLTDVFKNEFVFAARECAHYVSDYLKYRGDYDPQSDVEYVFDRGEKGAGAVVDLFIADGLPAPSFRASRDDPKSGARGMVQLQASDFLEYEALKLYEPGKFDWPYPETRKSFEALFQGVQHNVTHEYVEFMIERRCEERGISQR